MVHSEKKNEGKAIYVHVAFSLQNDHASVDREMARTGVLLIFSGHTTS